jgi:hypothetical protein
MGSYHKSLAGIGAVTLVGAGAEPDTADMALVTSLKLNIEEEDVDLESGEDLDIIDSFKSSRKIGGDLEVDEFSAKLLKFATAGVTTSAGSKVGFVHTAAIPTTPFTITVPDAANWDTDLVVVDLTAGKQLTRIAAAGTPTTGQYKVTAGVYTFAAADTGHDTFIRGRKAVAGAGVQALVAAAAAGAAADLWQLHYYNTKNGKSSGFYVPAARIFGLNTAFERKGWSKTSLKWKAVKPASGSILYTWTPE